MGCYLEAMQMWQDYKKEHKVDCDKLQRIHALENLACLLKESPQHAPKDLLTMELEAPEEVQHTSEDKTEPEVLDASEDRTPEVQHGPEDRTPEVQHGPENRTPEVQHAPEDRTPDVQHASEDRAEPDAPEDRMESEAQQAEERTEPEVQHTSEDRTEPEVRHALTESQDQHAPEDKTDPDIQDISEDRTQPEVQHPPEDRMKLVQPTLEPSQQDPLPGDGTEPQAPVYEDSTESQAQPTLPESAQTHPLSKEAILSLKSQKLMEEVSVLAV